MRFDADLATLEAFKVQVDITTTDDDARFREWLRASSRMITQFCRRAFVPFLETRVYDARGDHIDVFELELDDDLLEVSSLTNGDGTTIASSDYVLRPINLYPKHVIRLKDSEGVAWNYTDAWEEAISVAGIWGFHETYGDAWIDTLEDVPAGGLTSSDLTFTATDADGLDDRYRTRFQAGMILKVDSEFIKVASVDTSAEVVTILRGQMGTTAATHAAGTDIYSFAVMSDVEKACLDLAVFMERNRDTVGQEIQFLSGTKMLTMVAPDMIMSTMKAYRKERVYAL